MFVPSLLQIISALPGVSLRPVRLILSTQRALRYAEDAGKWTIQLWSENIEYGCPAGPREGCRDGDRVLPSTQLTR